MLVRTVLKWRTIKPALESIADPAHDASFSLLILCTLFAERRIDAKHQLRGWRRTGGAIGTADTFILSWLCYGRHNTALSLPDTAAVAAAIKTIT